MRLEGLKSVKLLSYRDYFTSFQVSSYTALKKCRAMQYLLYLSRYLEILRGMKR